MGWTITELAMCVKRDLYLWKDHNNHDTNVCSLWHSLLEWRPQTALLQSCQFTTTFPTRLPPPPPLIPLWLKSTPSKSSNNYFHIDGSQLNWTGQRDWEFSPLKECCVRYLIPLSACTQKSKVLSSKWKWKAQHNDGGENDDRFHVIERSVIGGEIVGCSTR